MNPDPSKLRHQEQQQQESELSHIQETKAALEFASVEELVRFDAAQTELPPVIAERLNESISLEPTPKRSWWRRFFRGG